MARTATTGQCEGIIYRLTPATVKLEQRKRLRVFGWRSVGGFGCWWRPQGCFAPPAQGGVGGCSALSAAVFGWLLLTADEKRPFHAAAERLEEAMIKGLVAGGWYRKYFTPPEREQKAAECVNTVIQATVYPFIWRHLSRRGLVTRMIRDGVPAALWLLSLDAEARDKLIAHVDARHAEQHAIDVEAVESMRAVMAQSKGGAW